MPQCREVSAAAGLARERLLTLVPRFFCNNLFRSEAHPSTSSAHGIISVSETNDEGKVVLLRKRNRGGLEDIHQAITDSVGSEFGSVMDVEHLHDIGAVNPDRVDADVEMARDFFI